MVKIPKQKLFPKRAPKKTKSGTKNIPARKAGSGHLEAPPISTRRLLTQSEGMQVDFKRDAEAVKPEDIVAFANGGGGTILIGVDEIRGVNGIQRGKVV